MPLNTFQNKLIDMRDMTHSRVRHASLMCDMTHSPVRHALKRISKQNEHMTSDFLRSHSDCDMTHSQMKSCALAIAAASTTRSRISSLDSCV